MASRRTTQTQSPQTGIPLEAMPLASDLVSIARGGLLRDDAAAQAGVQNLLRTQQGQFLTPETNPYILNVTQNIQRLGQEQLGSTLGDIRSRFALAGMPNSGSELQALAQAARQGSADISGQIGNLLANQYNIERGIQTQTLPLSQSLGQLGLANALDVLRAMAGTQTSGGTTTIRQGGLFGK